MNPPPPQAIAPLKDRLTFLRAERQRCDDLESGAVSDGPLIDRAINELEALIKRLENPNVSSPA